MSVARSRRLLALRHLLVPAAVVAASRVTRRTAERLTSVTPGAGS
jgi:hypothetical protein